MMDISSLAHAVVSSQGTNAVASVSPSSAPSELVTERFNAMMSSAPVHAVATTATPAGAMISTAASSALQGQGLGHQILAGLQSASSGYTQRWKDMAIGLEQVARHPSAANMLKVQSELLQASVQYELVGKAISRSTQNIDTLVRMS
ncbi:type III secretion system inner rod subunit SctI [Bordetella sp. 02P26C-1]|uniref:type III secretion system inner rod subunit SctI n=1 Tax=Bordetella sp. 02P26C-1 TaxID=2683195 RepID=UPI001353AF49|nr:type III secretion system inner rod subunit SctI [Bordetella sp. 02P26C-1]MVW78580.1 EscI/YscI/HrpB family type III secretion system inner rod protein [Bordetella sp. 02P26C-1]